MAAAALFWESRKCAWLGRHCICMLDVNTWAFYNLNKVDTLCADMPKSNAKQDKTTEVEGHKFKPPARNMCSCIRNRKWVPLTHLLQMPGLQKSLLLFSRLHKRHLVHYCLPMSKCEIQSQDCVIYGIYATSEAAHFRLNYLAPIFKVQEDIMDLWHTIFFSVLLLQ